MTRFSLFILGLFLAGPAQAADGAAVHERLLTLDSHIDIPRDWATDEMDPSHETDHQADLVKMKKGGLDAAFFIAYVGQGEMTPEALDAGRRESFGKLLAVHRMAERYPDLVAVARTPDDVRAIVGSGRIAALIGMENAWPVGDDLDWLRWAWEGGVRYVTITHNGHNQFGDSAQPLPRLGDAETRHDGLSEKGEELVAEMNRLGIMVDVSHTAESTTLDAARLSRAPVIASHSAVKALCDVPRNLSDKGLKAIAATGGVVQIVAYDSYILKDGPEEAQARASAIEEFQKTHDRAALTATMAALDKTYGRATVSQFVDHIDYAVKLIGIDHVGIASDFGGGGGIDGWNDASQSGNVTAELLKRGYSETDIGKLWSGNILHVLGEVEDLAKRQAGAPLH